MSENDCVFCETPNAKQLSYFDYDGKIFDCPVCGKFKMNSTQLGTLSFRIKNHQDLKLQIAQLLAERKLTNDSEFEIGFYDRAIDKELCYLSVDDLLKTYPHDMIQRLDRALLNLSRLISDPYDEIIIISNSLERQMNDARIAALLFASRKTGYVALNHLVQDGWLRVRNDITINYYTITPKGWEHIRELKKRPAGDTKQAFVAMWFDPKRDSFYTNGIKPACEETGYAPLRIDLKQHNEKICDEIIAEIRKSRILIADTTGNRGGVYFEAGFAMGLGLPVIYLFDKKHFDEDGPHFDTNHYNHIVYKDEQDLFTQLKNRILATVPLDQ